MVAPEAPWYYRWLQRTIQLILLAVTRLQISNLERVPLHGAVIVAINHIYLLDVVLVFMAIPRRLTVFAADKWRGTPGGWLMDLLANAIYVARGEVDRGALSRAMAVLRAGNALGLAPEGTRSSTRSLQEGKDGVAYLASRSGATIVPVAVWGHERMFHSWWRLQRPEIYVCVGEPIHLPHEAARAKAVELTAYTNQVMLALARMLPEQYRGVYAGRV